MVVTSGWFAWLPRSQVASGLGLGAAACQVGQACRVDSHRLPQAAASVPAGEAASTRAGCRCEDGRPAGGFRQ
jgi:hypothetical protein